MNNDKYFLVEFRNTFTKALIFSMENNITYFWDAYYMVQQLIIENSPMWKNDKL